MSPVAPDLPWPRLEYRRGLDDFRRGRLRQLVRHAVAHVPYQRQRFAAAGVDPLAIREVEDLQRLPVCRKSDLQSRPPADLCADNVDPSWLIAHATGGSTGQPLTVLRTRVEDYWLQWQRLRIMMARGRRFGDRMAAVAWVDPDRPEETGRRRFNLDSLRVFTRVFDCGWQPEQLRAAVAAYQPELLGGYPGALVRMALAAGPPVRPRIIFTGGEVLTPHARALMEEAFAAPVHDAYGAHEFNLVAWQCLSSNALHVHDEAVILEILDPRGQPVAPGQTGEVVCTALHSFAMPVIRYSLGDLATRGPDRCPCGCLLPTLQMVVGRQLELFHLADGRWIHPYSLIELLYGPDTDWVGQYQLIQEAADRVRLLVRPRAPVTEDRWHALRLAVQERCGPSVRAEVEQTHDIPLGANGKYRVSYSKVR